MVLTAAKCYGEMEHALGGSPDARIAKVDLLGEIGEFFFGLRPWRFLERRPAYLDTRATITLDDGTWVELTLSLTSVGAFTNYVWQAGDTIEIKSGTGATTGFYEVESRTSANTIVLTSSLSTAAVDLVLGDIVARMELPTTALPLDFKDEQGVEVSAPWLARFQLVDRATFLRAKVSWTTTAWPWPYIGSFVSVVDPVLNLPRTYLELWPAPSENRRSALTLFYRAKWPPITNDDTTIPIPPFCERAFRQLCRTWVQGLEMEEEAGIEERLAPWMQGALLDAALTQDQGIQHDFGPIENGHVTYRAHLSEIGWPGLLGGPV